MIKKTLKYMLIFGGALLMILAIPGMIKNQKDKPLCKNCNILLISLDTLSAKHLPCYGYDKNTAPNLCQFAKDNILFTNSYSQSSWTRPSQTSVLTGLHPSTHGVMSPFIDKLSPKYKTIQEVLKGSGYKTYYYGPSIDNDSWDESVIRDFDVMKDDIYDGSTLDHWNKALDVLAQNQKNKTPTFMYLHTYYVHSPYLTGTENLKFVSKENENKYPRVPLTDKSFHEFTQPLKNYVLASLEKRIKASKTKESLQKNSEMFNKLKNAKTVTDSEKVFNHFPSYEVESFLYSWYLDILSGTNMHEYPTSLYDEKIYQMDKDLQPIFDRINNKFAKDTIVIIYSDHGETLGERGSFSHCYKNYNCLYNETVRVPLIIKIPGNRNKKIEELTQGIDIYPTILKAVGVQIPTNVEGTSLTEMIKNGGKVHDYVVSERDGQKIVVDEKWNAYFRDYKNIAPDTVELYNLNNDMYEQKNVALENPSIVETKINQLKEFMDMNKNASHVEYNFPNWIDELKKEKLIKEGYF